MPHAGDVSLESIRSERTELWTTSFLTMQRSARYLSLLARIQIDARFRAHESDPQLAELLDAIHNLPDLLSRWPDAKEEWIAEAIEGYERKYGLTGRPYSMIIENDSQSDWQLRWTPPQTSESLNFSGAHRVQSGFTMRPRPDRNVVAFLTGLALGCLSGCLIPKGGFGGNALIWMLFSLVSPFIVSCIATEAIVYFALIPNLVMHLWLFLFVVDGPYPQGRNTLIGMLFVGIVFSVVVSLPVYFARRRRSRMKGL